MSVFYLNKDTMRGTILANLLSFVSRLPDTKAWKVEITEHRKTRTEEQNHALFGLAYKVLSEETGYTKDELHEAMCKRHFGTIEREVFGQVVTRPYRTTTTGPDGKRDVLPWDAFSEFYASVEQVAAEAGIYIPPPDPLWREHQLRRAA
jgi:hypothetical protein